MRKHNAAPLRTYLRYIFSILLFATTSHAELPPMVGGAGVHLGMANIVNDIDSENGVPNPDYNDGTQVQALEPTEFEPTNADAQPASDTPTSVEALNGSASELASGESDPFNAKAREDYEKSIAEAREEFEKKKNELMAKNAVMAVVELAMFLANKVDRTAGSGTEAARGRERKNEEDKTKKVKPRPREPKARAVLAARTVYSVRTSRQIQNLQEDTVTDPEGNEYSVQIDDRAFEDSGAVDPVESAEVESKFDQFNAPLTGEAASANPATAPALAVSGAAPAASESEQGPSASALTGTTLHVASRGEVAEPSADLSPSDAVESPARKEDKQSMLQSLVASLFGESMEEATEEQQTDVDLLVEDPAADGEGLTTDAEPQLGNLLSGRLRTSGLSRRGPAARDRTSLAVLTGVESDLESTPARSTVDEAYVYLAQMDNSLFLGYLVALIGLTGFSVVFLHRRFSQRA